MAAVSSTESSHDYEKQDAKVEDSDPSCIIEAVGEPPLEYPEGGWRAWLTVGGGFLMQFTSGYINSFGVYQDFFTQGFLDSYSTSQISWIGSTATFLTLSAGLVSGRLFDAGYFYHLIAFGCVLVVFCLFMLSLSQPQQFYQVYLSLGLGYGLGFGALYVPTVTVPSHWFNHRRALVMGIVSSGTSLGATLHPIMLNNLFHSRAGFANGVRASAALIAGCMVVSVALMRTRLPPKKRVSVAVLAPKVVRDSAYMCAISGMLLWVQGQVFPQFYLQLYSDTHGLSRTFGFYSLAILNMSAFFGRLATGPLVSSLGVFNATLASTLAGTVLLFSFLAVDSVTGVVIFAILYGFCSGAYVSLLTPLLASFATEVSEIGVRVGIGYACVGLGSLIGNPVSGALLTRSYHWPRATLYVAFVSLGGTLLFAACRIIVGRGAKSWKC